MIKIQPRNFGGGSVPLTPCVLSRAMKPLTPGGIMQMKTGR